MRGLRATLTSAEHSVANWVDGVATYFELGWSDGLPVVPATEDAVWRSLAAAGLEPSDVVAHPIGSLTPRELEARAYAAVPGVVAILTGTL